MQKIPSYQWFKTRLRQSNRLIYKVSSMTDTKFLWIQSNALKPILTTFIFLLIASKTLKKQLKLNIHKFSILWIFIKIISFRYKRTKTNQNISHELIYQQIYKGLALNHNVWRHGFTRLTFPILHWIATKCLCLIGYIFS